MKLKVTRKIAAVLLVLCLCISFTACGSGNDETPEKKEKVKLAFFDMDTIENIKWEESVIEQSNRHCLNTFCYDNNWIYGSWFGDRYSGEMVKVRYDNTEWTVMDKDTNEKLAYCRAVKDGFLYYSQYNGQNWELIKVRVSGEDAAVILENHSEAIQIAGDYIYYTTEAILNEDGSNDASWESSNLYRCSLDGENPEPVLEKPVYYFTVFGDYILYQDSFDDGTLHVYNQKKNEDERINDVNSFVPIFDGKYIYYTTDAEAPGSYEYKVWRLSADGKIHEEIDLGCHVMDMIIRDNYIYYVNQDDNDRIYRCLKDGSEIELIVQDANVYSLQWVDNGLAYKVLDENGYVDGVYLCGLDGTNKVEFCRSHDSWGWN